MFALRRDTVRFSVGGDLAFLPFLPRHTHCHCPITRKKADCRESCAFLDGAGFRTLLQVAEVLAIKSGVYKMTSGFSPYWPILDWLSNAKSSHFSLRNLHRGLRHATFGLTKVVVQIVTAG